MLRRIVAVAAALLALSGTAQASGCLCLSSPEVTALVDGQGKTLVDTGDMEAAFTVREGALYAAGRKGDYRLYDAGGHALGEVSFGMIDDQGDCLIFRSGARYGAMDASGAVLVPPEWTQLTSDGAGGFLALETDPLDERPDELVHIDGEDRAVRTGVYTACALSRVSCGRMPYMDEQGRYGAVDAMGNAVIGAQWLYVSAFDRDVASVTGSEGMGLIDRDGAQVLPPVYRHLERGEAMIVACSDSGVEVWSADGSRLLYAIDGEDVALVGDCLCALGSERVRLYDASGTILADESAPTRFTPGVGGQLIASDGAWGEACQWLVNPDGGTASGRYQFILPLCDGRYAWMRMDGARYYSDILEGIQTSWNYDSARWGLLDGEGNELLPAEYLEIRHLGGERLMLRQAGVTILADLEGKEIKRWE